MSRTKYVARYQGQIIGTRNSTIPTAAKLYTHAVAVWGHGKTEEVVTWCSRFDLAQAQQRQYQRWGFTAEIVPVEVVTKETLGDTIGSGLGKLLNR